MPDEIKFAIREFGYSPDGRALNPIFGRGTMSDRPMRGDLLEHAGELWEIVNVMLPKKADDEWVCFVGWFGEIDQLEANE